ncbi:SufD family Fe-S cluster assembly protein [uncultured Sphingomonas sp.]|uniref:SufD family Fe-S cluster assembly protein n=1 Tax=uncultured Sphingomonas sp. TaxID=158754 RepID=UPI0035CBA0B2
MTLLTLPSNREEAWRWADTAALAAAAGSPRLGGDAIAEHFLDLPGDRLLFVDGELHPSSRLLRAKPARAPVTTHALGGRATDSGWALRLAADEVVDPVQVVHLSTGGENHAAAEIVLAENAAATVVETFVGTGWTNRFTRLSLGDAARLQRSVRLLQSDGFTSQRDEAELGAGASLSSIFLGAGQAGSRVDGHIVLAGDAGYAEYGGVVLTRAEQRQECAVVVRHAEPSGRSRQVWRAVAVDQSQASLAARVEVARHAQKTDGEQSLRGLLLNRTAAVNLKPELEIFADDVKCAHGATVGELDARALFYMESRGIPSARAKGLLTHAFVADALGGIADEQVRDAFLTDAGAWLEQAL